MSFLVSKFNYGRGVLFWVNITSKCILYHFARVIWSMCFKCYLVEYKGEFFHDDYIKWKHIPRYWPFVRGIQLLPENFPHKGQRRGASMFSLVCAWTKCFANNWDAGDLETTSRSLWRHCNVMHSTVAVVNQNPWWWPNYLSQNIPVSAQEGLYQPVCLSYLLPLRASIPWVLKYLLDSWLCQNELGIFKQNRHQRKQ